MDFRQLRYFVQIVECESLSKASRMLYIAQPALSQQLAKLEEEVGKPLFHRSSKGVMPTDSGMALYHHARFMLRQLDQTLSIVRQDSGPVRGMVTVGLPATTGIAIGLPLVHRIGAAYPSILLNVVEGMSGHLAQMMAARQLDLAVLFSADAVPDCHPAPFVEEQLWLILPAESKLFPSDRDTITMEELSSLPLILPTGIHGLRRRIMAEFDQRDLTVKIAAEIDSLSLLMECVHDGMGGTIKPMSVMFLEGRGGRRWRAVAISDASIVRRNYIYSIVPDMQSLAAAAVEAEIRGIAKQLVDRGVWPGVRLLSESAQNSAFARATA